MFEQSVNIAADTEILAAMPVAVLIVVALRNVVGLKILGNFSPVLIGIALYQMQLLKGGVAFVVALLVSLPIHRLFEQLGLLLAPRLVAVSLIVVGLLFTLGVSTRGSVLPQLQLLPALALLIFTERVCQLAEEQDQSEAMQQGIATLFASLCVALVYITGVAGKFFVAFPELILVVLLLVVLLGRYTGYRLLELKRFRSIVGDKR